MPLAPNAQYQLVVSSAIQNLNGDRLEAEHRITFTTGESDMLASLFAGGRSLYVANDGHGTNTFDGQLPIFQHGITVYTGSAVPTDTIAGDNTGLSSLGPGGIAVDAAGRIYAASSAGTDAIFVYAPGATGNAAPATTHNPRQQHRVELILRALPWMLRAICMW